MIDERILDIEMRVFISVAYTLEKRAWLIQVKTILVGEDSKSSNKTSETAVRSPLVIVDD